ncbi:uncharacterized protein LOC134661729 [Cydia amplana]|uniref:uncharacterized protein LOC134661729 n=1 Tax=Cydia amplana TaxID=1869771 RepID=UPI002FE64198
MRCDDAMHQWGLARIANRRQSHLKTPVAHASPRFRLRDVMPLSTAHNFTSLRDFEEQRKVDLDAKRDKLKPTSPLPFTTTMWLVSSRALNIYYSIAGPEVSVDTTLNEYIRRRADLRGTKYMCLEGGCGACVVNARAQRPGTGEIITFSVNSCLVAVLSCEGWDITTIEGIGSREKGYNIIQKRLNNYFGTQCGYCSPGFVMSMYSLIQSSEHHLSEEEIEKSFGSNLCRCTGYRPILEAFKSFAVDPDPKILNKIKDIEDIDNLICPKSGKKCGGTCEDDEQEWCLINAKVTTSNDDSVTKKIFISDDKVWFRVNNIKAIFEALDDVQGYDNYMLISGNTSRGAYPIKFFPKVLVDISAVAELRTHFLDVNLVLGANTTLTDTLNLFDVLSKTNEDFWYLKVLKKHLEVVAHIPVRNIGTLAGNLILKHEHPDFQSDIFLLFSCVGAIITLVDRNIQQTEMALPEFLTTNIVGKVMTTIKLPPLSRNYRIVTYKIRPKAQNAHAEVNGAFLFKFDRKTHKIVTASIVYGGINPSFTHAYKTEKFLIGRDLFTNETLQGALHCLEKEVDPDFNPPEPSPHYRKKVALGLFYKCVIKLCPHEILNPIYASGATLSFDDRPPVSRSYQEYDTNKADYPITQPLLKKEGLIQCAGEAKYNDDIPTIAEEVFASFVMATIARGEIESVDYSDVLKIEGVIAVFTSKDIPGINTLGRGDQPIFPEDEELLASHKIFYYNQPVAIVVAETQVLADKVACLVKVNYKNISKKPIIFTIQDAIEAPPLEHRLNSYPGIDPSDRGVNVQRVIKGEFYSPRQYHHMMELHTTVTRPVDNGYEVDCSAQWLGITQSGIALVLDIPYNA